MLGCVSVYPLAVSIGIFPCPNRRAATVGDGVDEAQALWLVGTLQQGSEHPIGRAIAASARELDRAPGDVEGFRNRPGLGVQGSVAGRAISAGRPALLEDIDPALTLARELQRARVDAEAAGRTAIAASWDGAAQALFVVADTIKGNLFWAFAYNVAALPLAAAGLLNPMIAGAAMVCSSLFVVGNSLRLRSFSAQRDPS